MINFSVIVVVFMFVIQCYKNLGIYARELHKKESLGHIYFECPKIICIFDRIYIEATYDTL